MFSYIADKAILKLYSGYSLGVDLKEVMQDILWGVSFTDIMLQ